MNEMDGPPRGEPVGAHATPESIEWRHVVVALLAHPCEEATNLIAPVKDERPYPWLQALEAVKRALLHESRRSTRERLFLEGQVIEAVSVLATGRMPDGSRVPDELWARYLANGDSEIRLKAQIACVVSRQMPAPASKPRWRQKLDEWLHPTRHPLLRR